jgi:hypothetical protein
LPGLTLKHTAQAAPDLISHKLITTHYFPSTAKTESWPSRNIDNPIFFATLAEAYRLFCSLTGKKRRKAKTEDNFEKPGS